MKYLIINPGSTSKKYAFYEDERNLLTAHLEREDDHYVANLIVNGEKGKISVSKEEFEKPHKHIFDLLVSQNVINNINEIGAIGIRIVAPGIFFQDHKEIDDNYLEKLVASKHIAPLHISPVLDELEALKDMKAGIKLFGISDSAFHKDKPDVSKYYAIFKEDSDKYELYKFGYHGISIQSILHKVETIEGKIPSKIIMCHLGGGCSVTAIRDGKSVETSMGLSPLEGLTMATRVGDIDPEVVIRLAKTMELNMDDLEKYFNKKCGLFGLSNGKSDDIRDLLKLEENGDTDAKLALDDFIYNIKKYIGSYYAALNGVDMIVFSGTIGLRSLPIRERICKEMENLGIVFNNEKNNSLNNGDGFINSDDSKVRLAVIETDENAEMGRELRRITNNE
jgi:acetate kinase